MLQIIAIYLLKTIIVSALMLAYYWFALRNKRFHYYNRFYLLSAVVLSIALPLLNLNLFTFNSNSDKAINMFNVIYAAGETEFDFSNKRALVDWQQLALLFAVTVTAILLLVLAYRIITIYRIKKKFPVSNMQEFDFINTDLQQAPFSFLKNIFWRKDISLEENAGRLILQHELTHIKEKHTWDKLFMQAVIAVLWANPLYRLIQKELYLIHEFIADDKSVADNDTAAFATMLLHAQYGKFNFEPAQPFFYSPIKRRLIMLTTSKEPRFSYVRRIMALPLLACVVLLFAFRLQKESSTDVTHIKAGTTFKLVVDAGHGGKDNGALGINGLKEKDIALAISKKVKALSSEYGIEVILTRDNDIFMSPSEKVNFTNTKKADAFISIHASVNDPNKNEYKSGAEIFISPDNTHFPESKILGSALLQKLGTDFKINTPLMMRKEGIWVLKANPYPAALIECGYIDNAADAKNMTDNVQIETMARNILQGVTAYANNSKSPVEQYDIKLQDANATDTTKPKESKQTAKAANAPEIPSNVVYVLNGAIITKADMDKLDPNNIKSVNVLKDDEFAKSIYGVKGAQAAVIITTKDYQPKNSIEINTSNANAPLYVVNGNIMRADAVHKSIPAEDVLSMTVLKGEDAIKKYGDKGKNGVIELTTKNKNVNENNNIETSPATVKDSTQTK